MARAGVWARDMGASLFGARPESEPGQRWHCDIWQGWGLPTPLIIRKVVLLALLYGAPLQGSRRRDRPQVLRLPGSFLAVNSLTFPQPSPPSSFLSINF